MGDKQMRLKFLFFPIMLIVSLSIFIGYIWPALDDLKTANADKITDQNTLQAIKDKKTAIDKIDSQINDDSEGETVIDSYLPAQRVEERIIAGVNFLATDSGISLVNISLKDGAAAPIAGATADQTGAVANVVAAGITPVDATNSAAIAEAASASASLPAQGAASSLQSTEADISISGNYANLRLFLDQLQRMSIFNSIKSVSISAPVAAPGDAAAAPATDASVLSAHVIVDYGYLNLANMDNQKIANFQPGLDSSTIAVVKQYISKKTPTADSGGNSNGKTNPFLP